MSTFSGLNTAYTGLVAARAGIDIVGQNIANANTEGYTRQRVSTQAAGPVAQVGLLAGRPTAGQGVTVTGIARLGDLHLDARVRSSAAVLGYSTVRANALATLETGLQEPGTNGISAQLLGFWSAWQDVANRPGEAAPTGVLLDQAGVLAAQIAHGYNSIDTQWGQIRDDVDGMVAQINDAAAQVADLNSRIRSTLAAGGSVNELLDRRSALTTTLAGLAGGTVQEKADGTIDVLIGGNAIVTGDRARAVQVTGSRSMAAGEPIALEWSHRPGVPVALDGGQVAGALSLLAPVGTPAGTGGVLAEAAAGYNALAVALADQVNTVHRTGEVAGTADGVADGLDFFGYDPGNPAQSLAVLATGVGDVAVVRPGAGGMDGSIADAISQLGTGGTAPDQVWADMVVGVGVASRTEQQQQSLASVASAAAVSAQLGTASVDLDEENVNLLAYQHAYQGAARVLTAVDEMLDTLINRTGIVGR